MDVNEKIFRRMLALTGAEEYIDDLDAGSPLKTVAKDYVDNRLYRVAEALSCAAGLWREEGDDKATLDLTKHDMFLLNLDCQRQILNVLRDRFSGKMTRSLDDEIREDE